MTGGVGHVLIHSFNTMTEDVGSRNVERRRECFLHILALGILHGMCCVIHW